MRFYRLKKDRQHGWLPLWDHLSTICPDHFKTLEFLINNELYTEYSEEFKEAFEADVAWDLLCYQEPEVDRT